MENVKLTVEDVVKLVRLVDKVQKRGHYASIQFSRYGYDVQVHFMRNGFRIEGGYDFNKDFNLTDQDQDIDTYHEIVLFFTNIIEEVKEITIEEIEEALGYKICIVGEREEL